MTTSSKFDMPSSSPDRPIYTPRGSYTGASLGRSGSFRENVETPILSSLPSMSRSSDVTNFFHSLRFDPKSPVLDPKFTRQVEYERLSSTALGVQVDESSPSIPKGKLVPSPLPEDLKRVKASLRETSSKARERLKIINEATTAMNKCFPGIPSRKRSRLDVLPSERAGTLYSGERSVVGSSLVKAGAQAHAGGGGFEAEPQKSEEKVKIGIPNKRTRTSMVDMRTDMRAGTPARSSGSMDREALRLPSTGAVHAEERSLSAGVDGWEKSKMKKKRSGIKPDVPPGSVIAKSTDGSRETKQGMRQKLLADSRPRLNDSHVFRPGAPSGAIGVGKADGTVQQTSAGQRSSIPKAEQDNSSNLHDRKDRPVSVERERANIRAINKASSKEEFSSPSPTSNPRMSSTARAPRSGSNALNKLSPVVQRSTAANDRELSHSTSKNSASVGVNNRKRSPSMRPQSPPTQWASQRPQKISRTARRSNFVPIVSINGESPVLDATSDGTGNETGSALARRLSSNSPQEVKFKGDHFSSHTLSESEESGATETKVRDKIKKTTDEGDEKASPSILKVSTLPPRKNKLVNEDDCGDGVRRQGRTGRGFTSTRSLMPTISEKLRNVGTPKQLRCGKLGFEKTESKVGRPPSRKLERKPYTRQKQTTISTAADFHDDGHEELLAAASAVTDPALCFSSPFWRRVEPYFSFISDPDLARLKQQGNPELAAPALPILNNCTTTSNGFGSSEADRNSNHMRFPEDPLGFQVGNPEVPLCQRLVTALISEEEIEELCSRDDGLKFNINDTEYELDKLGPNHLNRQSSGNFQVVGLNGYKLAANGKSVNDLNVISEKGLMSNYEFFQNGLVSHQTLEPDIDTSESQYSMLSLDERLILELKSIGLSIEPVPDLTEKGEEDPFKEIDRLNEKYLGQVSTVKEAFVSKLFRSASETRGIQEKEFERRALDRLAVMAYEKYMASWGPNPSGGKTSSSKMAKQATMAFLNRTLQHCKQLEDTGKSCFSEDFFKDIFISGSARLEDETRMDGKFNGDSGKNSVGGSLDVRISVGTRRSPSINNHDLYSSNPLASANHSSEQFLNEEDSWSNRVKKRELSLDQVVGTISNPTGIGGPLSSSAKGKRSDRDPKNGTPKLARTTSGNIKGERKNKTKPKQKSAQIPASISKATNSLLPGSNEAVKRENFKQDDNLLEDPIDLSHLQLPGMEFLGNANDLEVQGEDFGSWLNIADDLPEQDGFDGLDGLEIPMDDLSELNMKF